MHAVLFAMVDTVYAIDENALKSGSSSCNFFQLFVN